MSAETPIGKALEKYLQKKVNKIMALEQQLIIGEYEGTLTPDKPEWKKLNLSLKLSTKTVDAIKKAINGYQLQLDGIAIAIVTAEASSLTTGPFPNPIATAQIYIREKAKEQSADLAKVIDEQGKIGYEAAKNSVKNSKKILRRIRDSGKNRKKFINLEKWKKESLQSEEIT